MRDMQRLVRYAAFVVMLLPLFAVAGGSAPSVPYEKPNAMFSARLDMTDFFRRLLAPFIPSAAPALTPGTPAQGTVPGDSLRFVFRDKKTNQPISHTNVSFTDTSRCTCPRGALCKPCAVRVFYEGATDDAGAVIVSRSSIERVSEFNLVVAGEYFGIGFSRSGNTYIDSLKFSRFDVVRDSSATIIVEPAMNEEERLRLFEKENPHLQRLPGNTPPERLKEMMREAEQQKLSVQPTPTPTALFKQEQINMFLKAIEEARKKTAAQGNRPSGSREPSPEEVNKIIKLFEEAGRKATMNRAPEPVSQPRPLPPAGRSTPIPPTPAY